MASSQSTPAQRAIGLIRQQLGALDAARRAIQTLRDSGQIDNGFATIELEQLVSRETDLGMELDAILDTGAVTNAPSDQQVSQLAAAVENLRNRNVTAANLQSLVSEAFTLAATVAQGSG